MLPLEGYLRVLFRVGFSMCLIQLGLLILRRLVRSAHAKGANIILIQVHELDIKSMKLWKVKFFALTCTLLILYFRLLALEHGHKKFHKKIKAAYYEKRVKNQTRKAAWAYPLCKLSVNQQMVQESDIIFTSRRQWKRGISPHKRSHIFDLSKSSARVPSIYCFKTIKRSTYNWKWFH